MIKSETEQPNYLAISPSLAKIFGIFYASGFLVGIAYSLIQQSYFQFGLDLLLLLGLVVIGFKTYRQGLNYKLILLVSAYGALLIFFTDSVIAVIHAGPNTALRILGNGIVIVAVSSFISLFSSRRVALVASVSAGVFYLVYSFLQPNQFYREYNIYIQPAFLGISIFLFSYRQLRDSWVNQLSQQRTSKRPIVNLVDYKITAAEYRCICYLMQSKINKEMAIMEGCSESSIQSRLGLIYRKLAVRDRHALMHFLGSVEAKWEPLKTELSEDISA